MADYIHLIIQKTAIRIMIDMNIEVSVVKTNIDPVFEIDKNDICIKMFLAE